MTLSNFEFSYASLTFGAGTGYGVTKADWSLPPVISNSLARNRLDGSYVGLDVGGVRPVTFDFAIVNLGDGNYYSNREAWRAAFTLQATTAQPLSMLIAGYSAARRFYGRPAKRHDPEDQISSIAMSSWSVQLDCDDPLQYSDGTHTAAAAASITVPNAGDYSAGLGPTAGIVTLTLSTAGTITGPAGGSLTLAGSGPWTLDLGVHTVVGGNGYTDLVQPAVWFTIPPGGTTVSASAGTVSAVTHDCWM